MGTHSSTFQLNVSTFCRIHWEVSVFGAEPGASTRPLFGRLEHFRGIRSVVSVVCGNKAAQAVLRSGRVEAPTWMNVEFATTCAAVRMRPPPPVASFWITAPLPVLRCAVLVCQRSGSPLVHFSAQAKPFVSPTE